MRLAETGLRGAKGGARPIIFFPRGAVCRAPSVKGLTLMVDSIYSGQRFEDLWLDR
jgi:peptide/nickel transport system substrate-binding protein